MPGPVHEGIVALLAMHPALAFELARRCGARVRRRHDEFVDSDPVFLDPGVPGKQFVVDRALVGLVGPEHARVACDGLAIEVQLDHDPTKWISWVIHRIGIRSRHGCRSWTLVVSPNPRVRMLGRRMFADEPDLCPLFLEPKMIPPIVEISEAERDPGMTILAAIMHASSPLGVDAARCAMAVLELLEPDRRETLAQLIRNCLTEDQMKQVNSLPIKVRTTPYELEEISEWEKRGSVWTISNREGRKEGRKEARKSISAELAQTLLAALDERGIIPNAAQRKRIRSCRSAKRLSHWLLRASTIDSADELFDAAH